MHRGQGKTIQATYLHHDEYWKSSSSFVALSRQTDDVKVFANKENVSDIHDMARQMARAEQKRSALSYGVSETSHEYKPVRKHDAIALAEKVNAKKLRDFQEKYEREYRPEYDNEYRVWAKRLAERTAERDAAIEAADGRSKGRLAAGEPRAEVMAAKRGEIAAAKVDFKSADEPMPRLRGFKQWLRGLAEDSGLAADALRKMEGKREPKPRPEQIDRTPEECERIAEARASLAAERTRPPAERKEPEPEREPEERRIPPPFFREQLRSIDEIPSLQDMVSAHAHAHDRSESGERQARAEPVSPSPAAPPAPPKPRRGWHAQAEAAQRADAAARAAPAPVSTPEPERPGWLAKAGAAAGWVAAKAGDALREAAREIGLGPREPPPPPDPERLLADARTAVVEAASSVSFVRASISNRQPIGKWAALSRERLSEAEHALRQAETARPTDAAFAREQFDDMRQRFNDALREASASASAFGINIAEADFGSSKADILEAVARVKADAIIAKEAAERAECGDTDCGTISDVRKMIADAERAFAIMPSGRSVRPHVAEIRAALDVAETALERADRSAKKEAEREAAAAKAASAMDRAEARAAAYHEHRRHEVPWAKDAKNLRAAFRAAQEVIEAAETVGAATRSLWGRLAQLDEALDATNIEDRERRKQRRDAEPDLPPLTPEERMRQTQEADWLAEMKRNPQHRVPTAAVDSARAGKTAAEARAEGAEALGRPDLAHIDIIEDLRRRGLAYQEQMRQAAADRAARGEREPDRSAGMDRC